MTDPTADNDPSSHQNRLGGMDDFTDEDLHEETPHEETPILTLQRSTTLGSAGWHPPYDDPDLLRTQVRRKLSSGNSSLVQDSGDAQRLADTNPDLSFDTSHSGAQFDDDTSYNESLHPYESEELPSSNSINPDRSQRTQLSLQEAIFDARVDSKEGKFLPLDKLESLVTVPSIKQELRRVNFSSDERILTPIARKVLEKRKGKGKTGQTTLQKIFAILVVINKPAAIVDVLRENIYDDDLPFQFKKDHVCRRERDGVDQIPIEFFRGWELLARENFETYQFQVHVPFFELSWHPGDKVYFYQFSPRAVLPFVEAGPRGSSPTDSVTYSGGTAEVQKVRIHDAHYKHSSRFVGNGSKRRWEDAEVVCNGSITEGPFFAVKKLQITEYEARFKGDVTKEALALKRFVDIEDKDGAHHHLIRLLASYTYGNQFHMILPWADGNLLDFWKENPNPPDPQDRSAAAWMAGQCLGLARALRCIHISRVDSPNTQELEPNFRKKQHGRHGDLKPENILYSLAEGNKFTSPSQPLLKISDFGFADFHRSHSLKVISVTAIGGMTPTYRAPEYEVTKEVSPAFDIWSFGCVLLEFSVWYVYGWGGIEAFSKGRTLDSTAPDIREDSFFNIEGAPAEHQARDSFAKNKARIKPSVTKQMNDLRNHAARSDFLVDFIDFVQGHMLCMNPDERAKCLDIVKKFELINKRGNEDPKYYTECTKTEVNDTKSSTSHWVRYGGRSDSINVIGATVLGDDISEMVSRSQTQDHSMENSIQHAELTPSTLSGEAPPSGETPPFGETPPSGETSPSGESPAISQSNKDTAPILKSDNGTPRNTALSIMAPIFGRCCGR